MSGVHRIDMRYELHVPFGKVQSHTSSLVMVRPFIGWIWMGETKEGLWLELEALFCLTSITKRGEFTGLTKILVSSTKHPWRKHRDR